MKNVTVVKIVLEIPSSGKVTDALAEIVEYANIQYYTPCYVVKNGRELRIYKNDNIDALFERFRDL